MSQPATPQTDTMGGPMALKSSPTHPSTASSSVATTPGGGGCIGASSASGSTPSSQPSPSTPGPASVGIGQGSNHPHSTPPPSSSVQSQGSGPPTPQHTSSVPNLPIASTTPSMAMNSMIPNSGPSSVGGSSQNNSANDIGNTNSSDNLNSENINAIGSGSPNQMSLLPQSSGPSTPLGSTSNNSCHSQPPSFATAPAHSPMQQNHAPNIQSGGGPMQINNSMIAPVQGIPQTMPPLSPMPQLSQPTTPLMNASGGIGGGTARSSMESQYMQTSSQIFVFSTDLANNAADGVGKGQFADILHFHCSQPNVMNILKESPIRVGQFSKPTTLNWLQEFPFKMQGPVRPNMGGQMFTHMNGQHGPHMSGQHPHQQQTMPANMGMHRGPGPGMNFGGRFAGPGNMRGPHPMNQFVPGPNQDFVNDKNLTAQQRRDREMKLAKISSLRQQLCPEMDGPTIEMMHSGHPPPPFPHGMGPMIGGHGPHGRCPPSQSQVPLSPHSSSPHPGMSGPMHPHNFGPRAPNAGMGMGGDMSMGSPAGQMPSSTQVGPRMNSQAQPKQNGKGRGRTRASPALNVKKERPPSTGPLLSQLSESKHDGTPPLLKGEPALIPVPSPQQIQYLSAFDGQELTIQKQPNTSLTDTDLMGGPGGELDLGFAGELVGAPGPDPKFPPPMDHLGGPPIGPNSMMNGPRFASYNDGPRFMGPDINMGPNRFPGPPNQYDHQNRMMCPPHGSVMNDLNGPPNISFGPGGPMGGSPSPRFTGPGSDAHWQRCGPGLGMRPIANPMMGGDMNHSALRGPPFIGGPGNGPQPHGTPSDPVSSSSTHLQNLQKMTIPFDLGPPTSSSSQMRMSTSSSAGSDSGKISSDSNNLMPSVSGGMNIPPSHSHVSSAMDVHPQSNQMSGPMGPVNGNDGFMSNNGGPSPLSSMCPPSSQQMNNIYVNSNMSMQHQQMNIPPGYTPSGQTPPLDTMGMSMSPHSQPFGGSRSFPNSGPSPGPMGNVNMTMSGPMNNGQRGPPPNSGLMFSDFPPNGSDMNHIQVKTNTPNRPNTIQYMPTRGPSQNNNCPRGTEQGNRFPTPMVNNDNKQYFTQNGPRPMMPNGPTSGQHAGAPPPNMVMMGHGNGPPCMNEFGPPMHGNQMGPGMRPHQMMASHDMSGQFVPGPPQGMGMGMGHKGMNMMGMDGDMGQPLPPNIGNGFKMEMMGGPPPPPNSMIGDMSYGPPGQEGQFSNFMPQQMYPNNGPPNSMNSCPPRMIGSNNMGNNTFFPSK